MPEPTYRPRDVTYFLTPFAGAPIPKPMGYTRAHGGVWPGTPAYPIPRDAGNGSSSSSSSSEAASGPGHFLRQVRTPATVAAALSGGVGAAGLAVAIGPQHRGRNAAIGGVLGAAAAAAATWWLLDRAILEVEAPKPQASNGTPTPDAGAPDHAEIDPSKVDGVSTATGWPKFSGTFTRYEPTTPPPSGSPPKPGTTAPTNGDGTGASTTSAIDAGSSSSDKGPPWGWILGGSLAVLVVGGVVYAASTSSSRRRRRTRGR